MGIISWSPGVRDVTANALLGSEPVEDISPTWAVVLFKYPDPDLTVCGPYKVGAGREEELSEPDTLDSVPGPPHDGPFTGSPLPVAGVDVPPVLGHKPGADEGGLFPVEAYAPPPFPPY